MTLTLNAKMCIESSRILEIAKFLLKKSFTLTIYVKHLHYLCFIITNLNLMETNINRIKVVLPKRKELINGYVNSWE